jgi:hypothetical protein
MKAPSGPMCKSNVIPFFIHLRRQERTRLYDPHLFHEERAPVVDFPIAPQSGTQRATP